MANLSNNVKTVFLKGLEALGKTASSLSDAASQKLTEMNLDTRRREVLAQIPKCVMQLWKDGTELPEPLTALLYELTEVENKLSAMRPKQEAAPAEEVSKNDPAEEAVEETVEVDAACPEEAEEEADLAEFTFSPEEDSSERPAQEDEDNAYNDVTEIADEPSAE